MAFVYNDLDFFLDDHSAKEKGIYMQGEPTISAVEANIETFEIPGRTGSLHAFDGTYKDRTISIPCYAVGYSNTRDSGYYTGGNGVYGSIASINAFLFPTGNEGVIQPMRKLKIGWGDTYYKVLVVNGADIAARLKTLSPFTIEFVANPIRYKISDDSAVGI